MDLTDFNSNYLNNLLEKISKRTKERTKICLPSR